MFLKILFYFLSLLLTVATLMPFIRKDHWTFRMFEFPRMQKLFLAVLILVLGVFLFQNTVVFASTFVVIWAIAIYLVYLIFPFTILAPKTLPTAKKPEDSFKLLISNVYQPNRHYDKLLQHIDRYDPELLLLIETDRRWQNAMQDIEEKYPYKIEHPKDNTYGMLFYSKYPIIDPEVRHLQEPGVPSLRLFLKMPGGEKLLFYGLHPPPPSPTQRTYSTDRDHELLIIAHEVKRRAEPVIVAGDLNDVAWSYTTDRFIEMSGLKDPRKGRGIYASYNARNIFMRWPLDHIFCSDHFKLVKMKLLGKMGSDHFPVLVELDLASPRRQR